MYGCDELGGACDSNLHVADDHVFDTPRSSTAEKVMNKETTGTSFGLVLWALVSACDATPTSLQKEVAQHAVSTAGSEARRASPSIKRTLPISTQGPLWPPSEIMDKDGNFVVVGNVLTRLDSGAVVPVPNRAVIVSKDTVPPLDANGKEDFSRPLGSPYTVLRELDLRRGSPDLDIELFTASYGPFQGDFGGGPRIPAAGNSRYNLNSALPSCLELFPATSAKQTYRQPSHPLHLARIWGLQGDQIAYDADTGAPFTPLLRSGASCGAGCPGENPATFRSRTTPIKLGEWLKATGTLEITLEDYNDSVAAFTSARFRFKFQHLLPRAVYSAWGVRTNVIAPAPFTRLPAPVGFPNFFVTDENGKGELVSTLPNPFPDPATDDTGMRLIGVAVGFHSDYQNWGACPARLGPGVDIHIQFNTPVDGTPDITDFVTKAAP